MYIIALPQKATHVRITLLAKSVKIKQTPVKIE